MKFALLFSLLSGFFIYFSLPAFELALGVLLIVPVFAHLLGLAMPLSAGVYYFLLVMFGLLFVFACSKRTLVPRDVVLRREAPVVVFFLAVFITAWLLCLRWPDFIAMGERLRDYAILASVIDAPVRVMEPWMSGYGLNYYAYWYRFGSMLSRVLGAPVWEVYHMMMAFSIAAYAAVTFRLFTRWLGFSSINAALVALVVAAGSNPSGIVAFLNQSDHWWGPSRVIPGVINEFPAWSFLLGDIHPHYLNLMLIPFFVLMFIFLGTSPETRPMMKLPPERILLYMGLCVLPFLWLKNANLWEVPMWGGLLAVLVVLLMVATRGRFWRLWRRGFAHFSTDFDERSIVILILLVLGLLSLYDSASNIETGEGNHIRLVSDPVARTYTLDLLKHWGFPIAVILISTLVLLKQTSMRLVALLILLGSLFMKEALVLLSALLVFNCLRVAQSLGFENGKKQEEGPAFPALVLEGLGIAGLGLLILPEIVFVDDAYGGENERMNIIFKIYTTAWFLMHAFAFYLLALMSRRDFVQKLKGVPLIVIKAVFVVLMLGFFYRTTGLRASREPVVTPRIEGLSEVEREFPGSAYVIRGLRNMPRGTILEAQGNPYSYTSFVSTLSGQRAYLGWANHVNLLTRAYEEVTRREKTTESIYTMSECAARREMVENEKIDYVVYGALERKQYPGVREPNWSCFRELLRMKEYAVYGVR